MNSQDNNNNDGMISLKVAEAYTPDVGRGVVRIDKFGLEKINANVGDTIEIKVWKKRTVAKCLPLYPADEGKEIIKIDGLIRSNVRIAIGDTVSIRKIKTADALQVIVAPLEAVPPIDERYLADALESVPLIKGDNIMVPYFGGRLTFQVMGTIPKDEEAVKVNQKTIFYIASPSKEIVRSYHDQIQQIIEKVVHLDTISKDEFDSLISLVKKTYQDHNKTVE